MAQDHVETRERAPEDAVDAAIAEWWAHLPDFLKPDYPLDIPPARLPFVQAAFTAIGAPLHCPDQRCRRSHECRGSEGPPCYRADRSALAQALLLFWAMLFMDLPLADDAAALRASGNRYAPGEPVAGAAPPPAPRRRVAKRGR